MEARYEDKQRGLFAGSVQEGGREGERYVSGRTADEMAGKPEEARIKNRFSEVKEYEIKEPSKGYKQLDLNFKAPSKKPVELDIFSDLPPDAQRVRMATTGRILAYGNTVQNIGQAQDELSGCIYER